MPNSEKSDDGIDQKTNDGMNVESTTRSCYIVLVNQWGAAITSATLTHNMGSNNDVISMPSMANNTTSFNKQINFQTGTAPSYDYWNVSFTDSGGQIWTTPNNDRCNISAVDEGTTVRCVVNGSDQKLHIEVQNGCNFIITKK